MEGTARIGLIGLGVMGENLALNIERNGYTIAVFNRTWEKTESFVEGAARGKQVIGCRDLAAFVRSIERPRKIILLVKAGDPVDSTIAELKPLLEKGDIIIDGGNSHFMDTRRREADLSGSGLYLIGSGVSGGEEGALWGPSLMPGGDRTAYEAVRPVWEAIAAKVDDGPCVTYLGPDGAGHFVKMVHNGIEYGDMQLIAEAYDLLRRGLNYEPAQIAEIFDSWNEGLLDSFLIEITSRILTVVDDETRKPLIDLILDKAGQKGTGKWTVEIAADLQVPIPTIDAALTARMLSALKSERVEAARLLKGPRPPAGKLAGKDFVDKVASALYASKVCSYAQGMALIAAGSRQYGWGIDMPECARIWKGGCIIRAQLLDRVKKAFKRNPGLNNLLVDTDFSDFLATAQESWREVVTVGVACGIPTPAFSASLAYYDSYRSASLPQNLTQAQRDYFGAHTYERLDRPQAGFVHSEWQKLVKTKAGKNA